MVVLAGVAAGGPALAGRHPLPPLASINDTGTASGNGESRSPVISANGRLLAFTSTASDLVANDTNGQQDVFVRNLATDVTTLVSMNAAGTGSGNGPSGSPVFSVNGRFVAFTSDASDLVPNDTNGHTDVFLRDLIAGTTTLVSANVAGTNGGNGDSFFPVLSRNARYVAFSSIANDLVVTNDVNAAADVFVRDLVTGTTVLVSSNESHTGTGNGHSGLFAPATLSPSGRLVAFSSEASDLVSYDVNGQSDVFLHDVRTGITALVSLDAASIGSGNSGSSGPVFSADGRRIAFSSDATNLVPNDTNGNETDVFVRDLSTATTTLVSVNAAGTASGNAYSDHPLLAQNGRLVAFVSLASDLVPNDTNGTFDAFVRNLVTGTTTLASVAASGGTSGNSYSTPTAFSTNGRWLVFPSAASDLVPNDTNGLTDVFVRDLKTHRTLLASENVGHTASGNAASGDVGAAVLSSLGRVVAFVSAASDLAPDDTNGQRDVFVHPTY